MIKVEGLSKSFKNERVLSNIHLSVNKGEIFGLLGPSGAGKTTLVKLIVGMIEPDQGKVWIDQQRVPSLKILNSVGYMAQSDALYEELSAKDNLHFFASLYGMGKQARKKAIDQVLQVVDLSNHMNKAVSQYSGGMKRRLSLAIALIHRPKLLILDEPTVGIDPSLRLTIWNELNQLKNEGLTIVVTTHVMDEAEKCDRLAMLRNGQVIACDTPENLKNKYNASTLEEAFVASGGHVR